MANASSGQEIILGVNGVLPRDHDAAACLIVNGEIVAAAEQERFSRNKKAFDEMPHDAISFCLDAAGVEVGQIDAITIGWTRDTARASDIIPPRLLPSVDKLIPVYNYGHHESHAASVFYLSPFESSAVLVVDGEGERESISIWSAGPEGIRQVDSAGVDQSFGYLYASVSRFCGLGSFGAGKIMGLAPYGEPKYIKDIEEIYSSMRIPAADTIDSQDYYIDTVLGMLEQRGLQAAKTTHQYDPMTLRTKKEPVLEDVHRDMAASVQKFLEGKMVELARKAKQLTGRDNLCMAGGVAMNCVTNSVIENAGIFELVYLQPACEDNGVALGSALIRNGQKVPVFTPYTGPSFTDQDIAKLLASRGFNSVASTNTAEEAARLIARGQIVGWFQGGLEYGPRALGNRSILANPQINGMQDRVNKAKRREPWRPFGPSVLAEHADDLFHNAVPSPYMLRSFSVKEAWRSAFRATVHVDGSTRPQTVTREENPAYYDLIRQFHRMTGIPGVLNTSYNDDREPIVATPDDAIKTFYTTGLNALVIGNHIIKK